MNIIPHPCSKLFDEGIEAICPGAGVFCFGLWDLCGSFFLPALFCRKTYSTYDISWLSMATYQSID